MSNGTEQCLHFPGRAGFLFRFGLRTPIDLILTINLQLNYVPEHDRATQDCIHVFHCPGCCRGICQSLRKIPLRFFQFSACLQHHAKFRPVTEPCKLLASKMKSRRIIIPAEAGLPARKG